MWCSQCRQEVRAVAIAGSPGGVACPRCQTPLSAAARVLIGPKPESTVPHAPPAGPTNSRESGQSVSSSTRLEERDFELEEELRAAERLLRSLGVHRIDGAHTSSIASAPGLAIEPPRSVPLERESGDVRAPAQRETASSMLAWFLMAIALTSGAFGGVLLAWSWFAARPDLWSIGLPFAVLGQALLFIGLFVQIDHLGHGQRIAKSTIAELDTEIRQLRRTAELMSVSQSAPSQSFYLHMAEGASPQLLLADVKGQLDLLASRLASMR